MFAFLVVLANTALLAVFLLYGLDLRHSGWKWSHGFLFATMVASTDAVAVTAVLKQGKKLRMTPILSLKARWLLLEQYQLQHHKIFIVSVCRAPHNSCSYTSAG